MNLFYKILEGKLRSPTIDDFEVVGFEVVNKETIYRMRRIDKKKYCEPIEE